MILKLVTIFCGLTSCILAVHHEEQEKKEHSKPYRFSYNLNDIHGHQYRKEEADDSGRVHGSYGYIDAEGMYREVFYIADDDGFRAVVKSNEPGLNGENPAHVMVLKAPNPEPEHQNHKVEPEQEHKPEPHQDYSKNSYGDHHHGSSQEQHHDGHTDSQEENNGPDDKYTSSSPPDQREIPHHESYHEDNVEDPNEYHHSHADLKRVGINHKHNVYVEPKANEFSKKNVNNDRLKHKKGQYGYRQPKLHNYNQVEHNHKTKLKLKNYSRRGEHGGHE